MEEGPKGEAKGGGTGDASSGRSRSSGAPPASCSRTHTRPPSLHIRTGAVRAGRQMCVLAAACSRHEPMVPKPAA